MAGIKRTITKKQYEKNREQADKASAKLRAKIKEETGKPLPPSIHVDHKIPIAKGGSPDDKRNLDLKPAKQNLKKGAKLPAAPKRKPKGR